jgi:hypothetical protein
MARAREGHFPHAFSLLPHPFPWATIPGGPAHVGQKHAFSLATETNADWRGRGDGEFPDYLADALDTLGREAASPPGLLVRHRSAVPDDRWRAFASHWIESRILCTCSHDVVWLYNYAVYRDITR